MPQDMRTFVLSFEHNPEDGYYDVCMTLYWHDKGWERRTIRTSNYLEAVLDAREFWMNRIRYVEGWDDELDVQPGDMLQTLPLPFVEDLTQP